MDFYDNDDYKGWLDMIESGDIVRSCSACVYAIKLDLYNLESPLYCYNNSCSHVGSRWTPCADARHSQYGICGTEALHFKISHV